MKLQRLDIAVMATAAAALGLLALLLTLGGAAKRPVRQALPQGEELPLSSRIALEASPGVDQQSLRDHLSITPEVAGEWRFDGRWLRFQPARPLPAGTTFTIRAAEGVETALGRSSERFEWSFSTRGLRLGTADPQDDGTTRIVVRDLSGAETEEAARLPGRVHGVAVLPDGRLIVSVENAAGGADLWIVEEEGPDRMALDCGAQGCTNPTASPRGDLVIYERYEDRLSAAQLWSFEPASSRSEPALLIGETQGQAPFFSDGGRFLGFSMPALGLLRVIDFDGLGEYQIPIDEALPGAFSEARRELVYADIRVVGGSFYPTLWIAGLEPGEGLHTLLDDPQEDFNPAWSADGELIAFARRYIDRRLGPTAQPAVLEIASGSIRLLDESPALNSLYFNWSPDGELLLVQRYDISGPAARLSLWLYDREHVRFSELLSDSGPPFWWP